MKLKNKIGDTSEWINEHVKGLSLVFAMAIFGVAEKSQAQRVDLNFVGDVMGYFLRENDIKNHPEIFEEDKLTLKGIKIKDNTPNLEFLRDAPELIGINFCSFVEDISALKSCPKLEIIRFRDIPRLRLWYKDKIEALGMGFKEVKSSHKLFAQYTRSGKSYDFLYGDFRTIEEAKK